MQAFPVRLQMDMAFDKAGNYCFVLQIHDFRIRAGKLHGTFIASGKNQVLTAGCQCRHQRLLFIFRVDASVFPDFLSIYRMLGR